MINVSRYYFIQILQKTDLILWLKNQHIQSLAHFLKKRQPVNVLTNYHKQVTKL